MVREYSEFEQQIKQQLQTKQTATSNKQESNSILETATLLDRFNNSKTETSNKNFRFKQELWSTTHFGRQTISTPLDNTLGRETGKRKLIKKIAELRLKSAEADRV